MRRPLLFLPILLPLPAAGEGRQPFGVCPPFPLRDEAGQVINPAADPKVSVPYSPRQTCGAAGCHGYAKTSYDFVTATCGNCHPGGGPMEYDRDGQRYDRRMADCSARHNLPGCARWAGAWRWLPVAALACLAFVLATPGLPASMTLDRFRLDANHFWVAASAIAAAVWAASQTGPLLQRALQVAAAAACACGVPMPPRTGWLEIPNRYSYTAFDLGLTVLAAITAAALAARPRRVEA